MTYAEVHLVLLVRVHGCGYERFGRCEKQRMSGGRAGAREKADDVVFVLCSTVGR
jgi:hypothetical protein